MCAGAHVCVCVCVCVCVYLLRIVSMDNILHFTNTFKKKLFVLLLLKTTEATDINITATELTAVCGEQSIS